MNIFIINQLTMQQYFTANQPHLQDHVDITIIPNNQRTLSKSIVSLGIDSLIYIKDLQSNEQSRIYLEETKNYHCIAKGDKAMSCFLSTENGSIDHFDLSTQQHKQIFKSQYKINSLTNSNNNRYLAACTQESKCILIDLTSYRTTKCRPGHDSGVANVTFSQDDKYLASIGMDKNLLIYNIQNFDQPLEMYRFKICKTQSVNGLSLKGSFNKLLPIFYCPGQRQLQIVELLNSKWQYRLSSTIKHLLNPIQLVKVIQNYIIVTSCKQQICIWNNKNQQKLVQIQQSFLYKVIEGNEKFYGVKNDGKIYEYKRIITQNIQTTNYQTTEHMQIEDNKSESNNNKDVINFDDQNEQQDNQNNQDKDNISQEQVKYQKQKRSKADQIIKALPQQKLIYSTSFFDGARYIFTNQYGYVIEKQQTDNETRFEFESEEQINNQLLFINKQIQFVDINQHFVIYANQTIFGVKFLGRITQFDSWEKNWWDITHVASSSNWLAIANNQEIKIYDLIGNQLKTISFDRLIVSMTAYENLLAIVYHESIPIYGSQCLTMQLYIINELKHQALHCSSCHVPIRPKSQLKFFRFTKEGMLISQDTQGFIRVYNLQNNFWTTVFVEGIQDSRRIWLLGMQNYQLIYWRTTEINPDPQVFPRLPLKKGKLGINCTIIQNSQQTQNYCYLMFERFCLDHQKCRSRLWGHVQFTRQQQNNFISSSLLNTSNILSQNELLKHHNQLDYKFFSLIKYYIKEKAFHKVVMTAKSLIRTFEAGKQLIEIIDQFKLRQVAVELEKYYDEQKHELQYHAMQQTNLQMLKAEAERSIKPKTQNAFMRKKNNNDMSSIPSLNNSQLSQASNFDNLSEKSSYKAKQNGIAMSNKAIINTPHKQEMSNPFLKRKQTEENNVNLKSRQIEEQIEKFGIKKKAQIKKTNVGQKNF